MDIKSSITYNFHGAKKQLQGHVWTEEKFLECKLTKKNPENNTKTNYVLADTPDGIYSGIESNPEKYSNPDMKLLNKNPNSINIISNIYHEYYTLMDLRDQMVEDNSAGSQAIYQQCKVILDKAIEDSGIVMYHRFEPIGNGHRVKVVYKDLMQIKEDF